MNRFILSLFIGFGFSQTMQLTTSKINYHGSHPLHSWIGTSSEAVGQITYDADTNSGTVTVEVALNSFDSRISSRDSNMLYYTDALDYPIVRFVSTNIEIYGDSLKINGDLSFHGVIKNINSVARVNFDDGVEVAGSFAIELSDFNVKRPTFLLMQIANTIKIDYAFQAEK